MKIAYYIHIYIVSVTRGKQLHNLTKLKRLLYFVYQKEKRNIYMNTYCKRMRDIRCNFNWWNCNSGNESNWYWWWIFIEHNGKSEKKFLSVLDKLWSEDNAYMYCSMHHEIHEFPDCMKNTNATIQYKNRLTDHHKIRCLS